MLIGKQAEAVEDQSINASRPLDGWVKTIDGQIVLNGSPPVRALVEIGLASASAIMMFLTVSAIVVPYLYSELKREDDRK